MKPQPPKCRGVVTEQVVWGSGRGSGEEGAVKRKKKLKRNGSTKKAPYEGLLLGVAVWAVCRGNLRRAPSGLSNRPAARLTPQRSCSLII